MTAGRFGPRDRFWHVLLPQHDVILSEGVYSESLFPGREALKMLSPISRASLVQSFDRSTYMMEFARQEIRRNPEVQEALSRPFRIATASDEDPSRDGINPPARAGKSPQRKIAMSHARSDIARSVYSVSPLT